MEEQNRHDHRRGAGLPWGEGFSAAEDHGLLNRLTERMTDPVFAAAVEETLAVLAAAFPLLTADSGPTPDFVCGHDDQLIVVECKDPGERACRRLWRAAWGLRRAKTTIERREAAREFLAALAELRAQLLQMLARVLLVLLSRLLGRTAADDVAVWKPVPIDSTPQIAPRGPNPVLPVNINRGGHQRSMLGSVVLTA
ncbi:hypothetical protein [Streptomyces murinus]|uniref:hypothetical protein n=1 Tax=Streptomyces murinus TaxID=33900 RepID=UPI0038208CB2